MSEAPRGANGFGWDAIFIPQGETRTFGMLEVTPTRVYRQKMKYLCYRGSRNFESNDDGLYLSLHLKNHGKEAFQPLDPTKHSDLTLFNIRVFSDIHFRDHAYLRLA